MVWECEATTRPARKKRPTQLRWKMGDLLSNKERQDEYAKCATERGVLASITQRVYEVGYTTASMEADIVDELKAIATEQLGQRVAIPGEGRVKTHTWRVTKAYKAKKRAGSALKRCRLGSEYSELLACKSAFKIASKHFAKVQDEEVRKMLRRNMEDEAAKGKPELSKKAHKAFKNITGTVSKDDGLWDIAT